MIRKLIILCLLIGLFQPVLAWSEKRFPDNVEKLIADTKRAIRTIDMHEFKAIVDKKAYDMIIDVRESEEYDSGRVPGAMNIPRGVIEFRIWRFIGFPNATDTSKRIFLYCQSGSRCSLATLALQNLGFSQVVAVDMKLKDWIEAGYPMETPGW